MILLNEGDKAPEFTGVNQDDKNISLNDYAGKRLILYFYPKDNTPACKAESCNLNESYEKLKSLGIEVLGISPDGIASHQRFIAKNNLNFNLIADTEKKILESYGIWALKKLYGREYMGVVRTTFVISENGIIEKIFRKVKTKDHTNQILSELNML